MHGLLPLSLRRSMLEARDAFAHDDLETAARLFGALELEAPTNVEIRLYAAWTRSRLASHVTDTERESLDALAREALGTRASLALPLNVLAHAALQRGELVVARRLFRRASEADPSLIDARRGTRLVEQRIAKRTRERSGLRQVGSALAVVSAGVASLVRL